MPIGETGFGEGGLVSGGAGPGFLTGRQGGAGGETFESSAGPGFLAGFSGEWSGVTGLGLGDAGAVSVAPDTADGAYYADTIDVGPVSVSDVAPGYYVDAGGLQGYAVDGGYALPETGIDSISVQPPDGDVIFGDALVSQVIGNGRIVFGETVDYTISVVRADRGKLERDAWVAADGTYYVGTSAPQGVIYRERKGWQPYDTSTGAWKGSSKSSADNTDLSKKPCKKSITVYIHGINEPLDQAKKHAQKIANSLGSRGVDTDFHAFTWPSDVSWLDFKDMQEKAEDAGKGPLTDFLNSLHKKCPDSTINIIAHSAGALVAISAMAGGGLDFKLGHVMFLNPYLPSDAFGHVYPGAENAAGHVSVIIDSADDTLRYTTDDPKTPFGSSAEGFPDTPPGTTLGINGPVQPPTDIRTLHYEDQNSEFGGDHMAAFDDPKSSGKFWDSHANSFK